MKKLAFILFTLVFTTTFVVAQDKKAPKAEFTELTHDFGKLEESDGSATTQFKLRNTGDAPLIIQRVQTTCGCTTPSVPRKPILPGEESSIEVTYSTIGRPGVFDKKLTVFSNVPNEVYVLTIKGEVVRTK